MNRVKRIKKGEETREKEEKNEEKWNLIIFGQNSSMFEKLTGQTLWRALNSRFRQKIHKPEVWNSNSVLKDLNLRGHMKRQNWLIINAQQLTIWIITKWVNPWSVWKYSIRYVLCSGTEIGKFGEGSG